MARRDPDFHIGKVDPLAADPARCRLRPRRINRIGALLLIASEFAGIGDRFISIARNQSLLRIGSDFGVAGMAS